MRAGLRAVPVPATRENDVVTGVERSLGRRARPFDVEFVLPVRGATVRQARHERFLVPERFYDGPRWPAWLGDLVRRIG